MTITQKTEHFQKVIALYQKHSMNISDKINETKKRIREFVDTIDLMMLCAINMIKTLMFFSI